MLCPYCLSSNIKVIDSRDVVEVNSIRRRRMCQDCNRRFTTYEKVDLVDITVIKKDGLREPFDRNKILSGIMKACEKRPISRERMEAIADKIERKIRTKGIREITSKQIGEMVIKELFNLDPIAYIRFASVYMQFSSPEEFKRIVSIFNKKGKRIEVEKALNK